MFSLDSLLVRLDDFQKLRILHPTPDVDLCAILFQPLRAEAEKQRKAIFAVLLDTSLILADVNLQELSAVEDVLMVGYPIGLWDDVNNFPLSRRGITATHPAVDFGGKSIGSVDIACFPGSSGSPVSETARFCSASSSLALTGLRKVRSWFEKYRHVELDEWIVMPNHFHGILVIVNECKGGSRTAPPCG